MFNSNCTEGSREGGYYSNWLKFCITLASTLLPGDGGATLVIFDRVFLSTHLCLGIIRTMRIAPPREFFDSFRKNSRPLIYAGQLLITTARHTSRYILSSFPDATHIFHTDKLIAENYRSVTRASRESLMRTWTWTLHASYAMRSSERVISTVLRD